MVHVGTMMPTNTFPGPHQEFLESGWARGHLFSRASNCPLAIKLADRIKTASFQWELPPILVLCFFTPCSQWVSENHSCSVLCSGFLSVWHFVALHTTLCQNSKSDHMLKKVGGPCLRVFLCFFKI